MRSPEEHAVATAIIALMQGAVYQGTDERAWNNLNRYIGTIRDHFARMGISVVIDDTEGYAYLRTVEPLEGEEPLPPLIRRRAYSYNVSLLLVMLRKRLLEFDASDGEGKLVLTREQIIDLVKVFYPTSDNEVKTIKSIDGSINRVVEAGFLRPLRSKKDLWEVPRIIKAYVDAETLGDLDAKIETYRQDEDE